MITLLRMAYLGTSAILDRDGNYAFKLPLPGLVEMARNLVIG